MRKQTHPSRILILCLLIVLSKSVNAALIVNVDSNTNKQLAYFKELTQAEVEAFTRHKMSFMEKVSFRLNKRKYIEKFANNSNKSKSTDGWAIAGFVCGILLPPVGIVFSAIALGRIERNGKKGKVLAVAGLVIGIVLTVFIGATALTVLLL